MFSTMTDRFFHGMNRRNTKLVDPSGIKSNLGTSRCRRSSTSKSKTNKLFQNSKQLTLRNSLNHSFQTPNSIDKITTRSTNFVPPLPFKHPQQRSRCDRLSKTSSQFAPPMAVKDLHTLLQKHINKQQSSETVIKQQNVQQNKDKLALTQNLYGTTKSFKAKFKQKIQQSALKRFSNVSYMQTKNNTERVEEENMRKLLHLMRKGKQTQPMEIPKSSFSNTILSSDLSKLNTKNENINKNKTNNEGIRSQIYGESAELERTKTAEKEIIQKLKNPPKQKKPLAIATTIKQAPISMPSPQKSKVYPTKQEQVPSNTKIQLPERIYKQSKTTVGEIKPEKEKKEGKQINLRIDLKKIADKQKQIKAISQLKGKQQNNIKKNNKMNIQDHHSSKSIEIPQMPQQRDNNQHINKAKQKTQQISKQVKKVKKYATQQQQQPNPKKENIDIILDDDLQQITLGFVNQTNNSIKDTKSKTETTNIVRAMQTQSKPQIKQKTQNNTKIQLKRYNDKDKNDVSKINQVKDLKKQAIIKPQKQKQYKLDQIAQLFEYYLGLIDQIGAFCIQTKQFYEQNQIQVFKQYNVVCFYLWQHLYFLRQKCLDALSKKDVDWYQIPRSVLSYEKFADYFKKEAANVAKQEKKCHKNLISFHDSARPDLEQDEKVLSSQEKYINKYQKCLKILHMEFKEIEKAYKKAVANEDSKEGLYIERLCTIIQMFCQIKCLNGQQVKDLQQVQAIDNLANHYQNNKHLIVL